MAAFYALIIRNPDVEEDEETDKTLKENEEFLHRHYTGQYNWLFIIQCKTYLSGRT